MKGKQLVALLALPLIWGGYYVATQQAVQGLSLFVAGTVIRFITMIFLGFIMLAKKELGLLSKTKHILGRLIIIGLLGFLLDLTAFIGLSMSAASTGIALLKCDIIFVNLISAFIYKEKFTKKDWFFTLVMLGGVVLVLGIDFQQFSFADKSNIFFVLSALFVSINAFVIKNVQMDKRNPAADNVVAFYNNFITMLCFAVSSFLVGGFGKLSLLKTNQNLLVAVLLAGLGQTMVYLVYYFNLRRFPVWIVKVFLLIMPLFSSAIMLILFDEHLGAIQWVGMGVVLLGALGILMEQRKKQKKETIA